MLLELNTQLAASVFGQIGALEVESELGGRLCKQILQMGEELQAASDGDARATALSIAGECARSERGTELLMGTEQNHQAVRWEAPNPNPNPNLLYQPNALNTT